jgi:signal transduction histidine kinase
VTAGPRWFQRLTIRWRLMMIGLVGLAVALLAAGTLLYAVLSATLTSTLGSEASAAAGEVATMVDQGRLSDPVPVSGALVVQVLDSSQRVVAGSPVADRLTPLLTAAELTRALAGEQVTVPGSRSGLSGGLQVAAVAAGPGSARVTVVAGVPTGEVDVSLRLVRTLLVIGLPVLLLVLAAVAWRVIGAALAPVEALRMGAERIGADPRPRRRSAQADGAAPDRLPVPETNDEIRSLATTLNGMLDRLDALSERQQTFLDDAAHELRSPLASLRTQLEVADHVGDGGSLPAELLPDIQRLSLLVDDLLVLARSGSGPASRGGETVDLTALLREIVSRYAAAPVPVTLAAVGSDADAGSELGPEAHAAAGPTSAGDARSLTVTASRADLMRVVTNLVDNAVRHASTRVTLAVGADPSGTWLRVTDDGHGIPPADRERVFERFTRLDEARDRDTGGTGLGLPIARELLRRNGADVTLADATPGVLAEVRWTPRQGVVSP